MFRIPEEFLKAGKRGNLYIEIFVNPDLSELNSCNNVGGERSRRGVRFIADFKTKKLYAFSAELIHLFAADMIYPSSGRRHLENLEFEASALSGQAEKQGSKYVCFGSEFWNSALKDAIDGSRFSEKLIKSFLEKDWSWFDRYILVTPWIEKFRLEYLAMLENSTA